jgi:hypothetical protein
MSLIALMLAAAVSAAAPQTAAKPVVNLYPGSLPAHCRTDLQAAQRPVAPSQLFKSERASERLRDMPRADLHLAVDRRVDGCPVPTVVRFDVEGDGRAAKPSR